MPRCDFLHTYVASVCKASWSCGLMSYEFWKTLSCFLCKYSSCPSSLPFFYFPYPRGTILKHARPFSLCPTFVHNFSYFPSIFLPWASLWISFDLFSITNPVLCFANLLLNYNIEFLISGIFFSSKIIWFFFFYRLQFCVELFLSISFIFFKKNILYNN